ncbi:MAG: hypothetical protein E7E42_02285 [Veillonella sp.]|nr:hypothetical protein [Veillonella sp.]
MKRKHNCRVHFDADSFQISDCTVAPVHDIPDVIHENQEFDFYVESTYDVYLLRIIHSQDCVVSIYPAKVGIRKVVLHFVYSDEIGRKENNTTLYRNFLSHMMWYFV